MKKLIFLFALLAFVAGAQAQFAPSVTGTYALGISATTPTVIMHGRLRAPDEAKSISIAWISDATGRATVNIYNAYGTIERVAFNPDDATAPTNLYDVVLEDIDGIDVLGGKGANLSSSSSASFVPLISTAVGTPADTYQVGHKYIVDGQRMQLKVTNAGSAKRGVVRIYMLGSPG